MDKPTILTSDLRATLKQVMQAEIQQLPETLKAMPPEQRLQIVCKLMPFVFPKVDTVQHTENEPLKW